MPGLFGILNEEAPVQAFDLHKMAQSLKPEIQGISEVWLDDTGILGWGREVLEYVLPPGQPITGEGEIFILLDGEIVECREAGQVNRFVLDTYRRGGCEALGHLNGGVCAGIWERRPGRLTLLTDYLGLRPLFYIHQPGRLAFASEIKALLALNWLRPQINEEALAEWLAFEVVDGDRTLFEGVKRLPPGAMLIWEKGQIKVCQYAQPCYVENGKDGSESRWVEMFIEGLRQSLQRRLGPLGGFVLPLSGGLDSRFLLALLYEDLRHPLPLVTYGGKGSRDVERARKMAEITRYPHQVLYLEKDYLTHFARPCLERTEGFLNVIDSHGWVLNRLSSVYKVLVLGNGADLFLNTAESSYPPEIRAISDPFDAYFAYINDLFKLSEWKYWFTPGFVRRFLDLPRQRIEEEIAHTPGSTLALKLDTHRLFFYEVDYILHGLNVIRPRFEYTEPYLDRDLVELMLSLPPDLRKKRRLQKLALMRLSPELARVEGGPLAHPSALDRWLDRFTRRCRWGLRRLNAIQDAHLAPPSSTFADVHQLLRLKPNRQWLEKLLLGSRFLERGWFRPEAVRQAFYEHMHGQRNHTRQLGAMATIELLVQRFIEEQPEGYHEMAIVKVGEEA